MNEHLALPEQPTGTGVLVLGGSSGRVEVERAELLATVGATALTIRWFGGPGQPPAPYDVPLETFVAALDRLAATCQRLVVLGTSFGAEAALLTGAHDDRVAAVVGISPSHVVWSGVDRERVTSHWTLRGEPLPFVPYVEDWVPETDPPAYRGLYEASLAAYDGDAAIAVELIPEVLVVAGEADQVWPGADFARAVARRRSEHGLDTVVVTHPEAGHRPVLPGEHPATGGQAMARGGTPEADAELGARAWPELVRVLRGGAAGTTAATSG